jgi:hypothetical protein
MRRGIALFVSIVVLGLGSPVLADDEIEMEPEPAPKKPAPPPPKKEEPKKEDDFFGREPQPVDRPTTDGPKKVEPKKVEPTEPKPKEDDTKPDEPKPEQPAVVKDPKLAKKVLFTAQQSVLKADYLARLKKADDAKKEYEAAQLAFLKAIELGDDPNVYYELALVEEKLGKLADAAIHLRAVIKTTTGVRPDVLKKSTTKYDELITKLGLLTLAVKPEGTTISLNNVELGKAPLALPLILMPGTYTFSFAAEGHQLKDLEIKVEAGSETERGVDLEPIKIIVEPKAVVTEAPPPPPPPPTKLPLLIGAGATGGFLVIGIITGSLAVGKQRTFAGEGVSMGDREDARSSGQTLAAVTDVFLVGSLAAAGFTAYWWYFKYRPAQKKLKEGPPGTTTNQLTKVLVTPWVQSEAGGVSFGGRF